MFVNKRITEFGTHAHASSHGSLIPEYDYRIIGITASYINPMESENVYITLFLHQGLDIYLYCEYHDEQQLVLRVGNK